MHKLQNNDKITKNFENFVARNFFHDHFFAKFGRFRKDLI